MWGEHRPAKLVVTGNEIKNNKRGSGFVLDVYLDNDLVFENNVIENNEGDGLVVRGSVRGDLSIQSNKVKNNRNEGIYLRIYGRENRANQIVIKDNEVSGKEDASGHWNGSGITLDYQNNTAVEIAGNTVENMRDYGIFVKNYDTRTEARIEGNTVKGNGQAGLRVYGRVLPVVRGNTFDGHRGGLILTYTDSTTSGEFEVSGNAIGSSGGITSTGGYGVRIEEYAQPNINEIGRAHV